MFAYAQSFFAFNYYSRLAHVLNDERFQYNYRTGRFIGEDFILAIGDLFNFSPIFKTPTKYIRYDTPTIN